MKANYAEYEAYISKQNLVKVVEQALPALSGSKVHYDAHRNMICTSAYTSAAGNSYYQGIRLSDRLIINVDFGQGYAFLFMNGLKLYCFDGQKRSLIGNRSYRSQVYEESYVAEECEKMLFDYLKSQSEMMRAHVVDNQLHDFAINMVREAMRNNMNALN